MDTRVNDPVLPAAGTRDPALRLVVERLLADTVRQPCYHDLCRENRAAPDAVYRLIDGLTGQLQAQDELLKVQSRTIERLRFQLVELVKEFTSRDGRQGLQ